MKEIKIYAFADEASNSVDEQIEAMLRNKLDGLEIRGVDGQNVSDITLQKAKEVKEKLDKNGLVTWSIGSPIGKIDITDDFAPHLEKFKHTLEVAKILGAKNIRMFSFYIPKDKNPDDYKTEVFERIAVLLDEAEKYGIRLCHENEKGIFGDNAERCSELHKKFPKLAGIFDPANFVQCGVDTAKAWQMLKPYICYMHIKDAKSNGMVVPAGKGDGNLNTIVTDFIKSGGCNFTIEPHLAVFDGFKNLENGEEANEFMYENNAVAFDTACAAFKEILKGE